MGVLLDNEEVLRSVIARIFLVTGEDSPGSETPAARPRLELLSGQSSTERCQIISRATAWLAICGGLAHEIRTPMNGIIGIAELVLETPLEPEQREYLGVAGTSAHALLRGGDDALLGHAGWPSHPLRLGGGGEFSPEANQPIRTLGRHLLALGGGRLDSCSPPQLQRP